MSMISWALPVWFCPPERILLSLHVSSHNVEEELGLDLVAHWISEGHQHLNVNRFRLDQKNTFASTFSKICNFAKKIIFFDGIFLNNIYSIWKLHFCHFPEMFCHQQKVVGHQSSQAKNKNFHEKSIFFIFAWLLWWSTTFCWWQNISGKCQKWSFQIE